MSDLPRIAVLMAAYNGAEYIAEQLTTILASTGVDVHIFLSDDGSKDATVAIAEATAGDRLTVLAPKRSGSAGQNFIRLILDTDWQGFDYVSLTDQDDIWRADKLARAVQVLKEQRCAGYSSDVTAFGKMGGKNICISRKNNVVSIMFLKVPVPVIPMYSCARGRFLRHKLQNTAPKDLAAIVHHDWFFYSIFRSAGKTWHIDHFSGLLYRQHDENVLGAATGWYARLNRLRRVLRGHYFQQAALIARIAETKDPVVDVLNKPSLLRIWPLITQLFELRRVPKEAIALFVMFLIAALRPRQT